MLAVVATGHRGLDRVTAPKLAPWAHTVAGLVLVACGVAMQLGL